MQLTTHKSQDGMLLQQCTRGLHSWLWDIVTLNLRMLQDIRTSPRERDAKSVLSKSRDYAASIALLSVLQKPGIRTWRIETPDLAPESSFLRSKSTSPTRSVRAGIPGSISLLQTRSFHIITIFQLFEIAAINGSVFASLLNRCK